MKSGKSDTEITQLEANTAKVLVMASSCINFSQKESCGKCVPGRIGSKRMLEILERIKDGEGNLVDIDILERLGNYMKITSLCPHGRLMGYAMLAMITAFRDEFEHQINSNQI